ncbi:catalase family peroxidase [Janthinobacterium sp. PC23-8]|uniref:catalase family peroxidase n=1 Tax=Janthinobacterium sp. PC23-8 TaxID=2012679 RepID=UPI000B963C91|nr:catalase family peroxidase [Janthinobacterium sp. PC23-8]OYO28040.1 catalase [Janthinobacterium sp. PC23-8]
MPTPTPRRGSLLLLLPIALILLAIAALFAWVGGWFGNYQLTPQKMMDFAQTSGKQAPGFRRAHSKGVCFAGTFAPMPKAASLSKARAFSQPSIAVIGRFSAPSNNPYAPDGASPVRGMAVQLKTDDGQEWRIAMNSFPFFAAATPQAFQAMNEAGKPDPATGKPDPEKMQAVLAAHPEIAAFQAWAKTAPRSDSLGSTRFNGVNAFQLTNAQGEARMVRWSMRPRAAFVAMTPAQLKAADADFLIADLNQRLAAGPLAWDMVVQIAEPGDAVTDPSRAWPDTRKEVTIGTLTLAHAEPQASGPCRDLNFDPLILPDGIKGSDDPILRARSAAYSVSFNRREREISAGKSAYPVSQNASAR